MLVGSNWLELAVVSVCVLGLITLMLVIRALDRGRERQEIVQTTVLIWAAVAITLTVAWLLEGRMGGAVFDVRIAPEPEVVTRLLTTSEIAILAAILVVLLALYVTTVLAVRRLLERREGDPDGPLEIREDERE